MRTWQRLEPRTRDRTLEVGLRAGVHDPLWLLARQWQWGEFAGEDAGSPVSAHVPYESNALSRIRPLGVRGDGRAYDPALAPLEAAVEAERAVWGAGGGVRAAEAGLHLVRRLRHALGAGWDAGAVRARFPLDPARLPPDRRGALARAPDGDAARIAFDEAQATLGGDGALNAFFDAALGILDVDHAATKAAFTRWAAWVDGRPPDPSTAGPPPGWVPERMEYAVAVAAPDTGGETALAARAYVGGRLDWYAFDAAPPMTPPLGAAADGARRAEARAILPTPVRFPGMPLERWWTFEDGGLDVGALDAAPEDLARLVLTEFVVTYGNDWFALPLELDAGTLTRLGDVRVMNVFGEVADVRPASRPGDPWQMYALSGADGPLFFLAPALPPHPEGAPVEEVRLVRDEGTNLVWAVERAAPDPATGAVVDRYERHQRSRAAAPPAPRPAAVADVAYRLGTEVPDYWFPLVPARDGSGDRSTRLVQGRLLNTEEGHLGDPFGQLLRELGGTNGLREEEAPRSGAHVTRGYQLARWSDGSTHVWLGRHKRAGRGEGSSGLRYDLVEPAEKTVAPPEPPPDLDRVSIRDVATYVEGLETAPTLSLRAWFERAGSMEGPRSAWATVRHMARQRS